MLQHKSAAPGESAISAHSILRLKGANQVFSESILILFIFVRLAQHLAETHLSNLNYEYYNDPKNLNRAKSALGLSQEDLDKSIAYANERLRFSRFTQTLTLSAFFVFLFAGGFGLIETSSLAMAEILGLSDSKGLGQVTIGLLFFAQVGLLSTLWSLPFSWHQTFVIEEKFGFNKTTRAVFIADLWKSLLMSVVLGGLILTLLLWIMGTMGDQWWVFAWVMLTALSLVIAWIYPTLLAPLFNKFSPLPPGELMDKIHALAAKVGFTTNGLFVMNASLRSSHGNAYFTGVFGKKRIVLFDTLIEAMTPEEVTAVLAHELGHFKLHHVRWGLLRGLAVTGVMFYALSLALPLESFYQAFHLQGVSDYGALFVFSLWYGPLAFLLQPLSTYLSRKNEFAADAFAKAQLGGNAEALGRALLKLREKSSSLPIYHPTYSMVYHSHPPMIERLQAMGFGPKEERQ
jgi:STE24 endopeptidase